MTFDQIKTLLAMAAARDNRTPSAAMAAAWSTDLSDLDFNDAVAAMNAHFRDSTEYLTPAHIRARAKVLRDDRKRGTAVAALAAIDPHQGLTAEQRAKRVSDRIETCLAALEPGRARMTAQGLAGGVQDTDPLMHAAKLRARAEKRDRTRKAANPAFAGLMRQATAHIQPRQGN